MASDFDFTDEEMKVDESVGFPRAYAMLCRDRGSGPYGHGPPLAFVPYCLHDHEFTRARELDKFFPVIDPKAKQTAKPRIFVSLLWKQLNHLGNAGFDPAIIRVDPYGNVLYYHADSASPLAWEIDHWFPCSRGGLTVPSNLRILQWQACRKKHNKLEFLIPWWDFQLGISVNQFLSIFASSYSDFRHRAFSFLFADGENEELNSGQTVESHSFPQHFVESKELLGLAPAAIVTTRRDPYGSSSSILQSVDYNRLRSRSPVIAARKLRTCKENENPDFFANPHQAIVMARDSLKQREVAMKMQEEARKLDEEVSEMRQKNEEEKVNIQDLELTLIKRRRRAEKCRRLAEAQSSYKSMLEKMIRDAMHQSVVYKEQVRLNQAAASALMARLEAQRAICDASEKDLHKKYKQRDELEKQVRPELEQGRKRSRMDDGTLADEEVVREQKNVLYLPSTSRPRTPLHKELRVLLDEEHEASEAGVLLLSENERRRSLIANDNMKLIKKSENFSIDKRGEDRGKAVVVPEEEKIIEQRKYYDEPQHENTVEKELEKRKTRIPMLRETENEEDEEIRKERGKGNVEKWLQMLLENAGQEEEFFVGAQREINEKESNTNKSDDIITKLNLKYPQKEIKNSKSPRCVDREDIVGTKQIQKAIVGKSNEPEVVNTNSVDGEGIVVTKQIQKAIVRGKSNEPEVVNNNTNGTQGIGNSSKVLEERRYQSVGKERKVARSESSRGLRRIPSSPSIILGMKKGVDCIGKKPMVNGDDEEHVTANNGFLWSSIKTIKKAVKI